MSQRARLTCRECYRRKIKCDKTVPCSTCVKRGIQNECTRDDQSDSHFRSSPSSRTPAPESRQTTELLQRLIDRVSHLESALKENEGAVMANSNTDLPPNTPSKELDLSRDESPSSADEGAVADSATVLEFLAWGRRKDQEFHEAPENETGPRRHSVTVEETIMPSSLMDVITAPKLDLLEALLPSKQHVLLLSEFHEQSLLWYHGSYMALTFSEEIQVFYSNYQGNIRHPQINYQWMALLFAVMTGSITCASESTAQFWGFGPSERSQLSRRWYDATVTCLNLANYLENHTIYSVSAIATLTISAHILGLSNTQSVLLAGAARIAQSLGLHRLGEEKTSSSLSESELKRRRKREVGRRIWCQLCTQDWFSIPFSESYSLNSAFFDTKKPLNCNDIDMKPLPQTNPTITSYCNYLYEIALLIPQLQDAMAGSNTLYTKYEQVLRHDEKMRALATAYMPTFLSNSPVASTWPSYVPWARRSLAICLAHKIIMIHRKFLGLSFTNSAFAFSRRTCIAASKTILKEARAASDDDGPVLWIDQAFVVAAGIILSLDAFHRKPDENEFLDHQKLAGQAIEFLLQFPDSKISTRGLELLSFLTKELDAISQSGSSSADINPRKRRADGHSSLAARPEKRGRVFNLSAFLKSISSEMPVNTPAVGEADDIAWEAFAHFLPQTGFGDDNLFDDFFSFEL